MDISAEDDQALQAVIGGLDHDQMDFKRLEELLSLSSEGLGQNSDIFFDDIGVQPTPVMTQSKTEDSQSLRDSDDLISYITGPAVLSPPESEHDPYSPESRAVPQQVPAYQPPMVHSVQAGQMEALMRQQAYRQQLPMELSQQQQLPLELTQHQLLSLMQQQHSNQAPAQHRIPLTEQLPAHMRGLPHSRVFELKQEDPHLMNQRNVVLTPSSHGSPSPQLSPASVNGNQRPASNSSQCQSYESPGVQPLAHQTFANFHPQQQQLPQVHPVATMAEGSVQDIRPIVGVQHQYASLPRAAKKRRLEETPLKTEPQDFDIQDLLGPSPTEGSPRVSGVDIQYQCLKWQPHAQSTWFTLLNADLTPAPQVDCHVEADKGFNFSTVDDSFVCQKKNHFQVTVVFSLPGNPKYVNTQEGAKPFDMMQIIIHGLKLESQSSFIKVEQSQTDRSKQPYSPVSIDIPDDGSASKITVGRLHFSETTSNNMRKKGKPNTDQRYFSLVVALQAQTSDGESYCLSSFMSERIIVRASNPGQFENDPEQSWKPGSQSDTVFHTGRVGINTDRPDEALSVHGNIRVTGRVLTPSDQRAKEVIGKVDTRKQLKNVSDLPLYSYKYRDTVADYLGLPESDRHQVGVMAQELQDILPDAVRETEDIQLEDGETIDKFLVVDKDRLYMENVGAVKELCKLTDNLETRIHELEHLNRRLKAASLKRSGSSKYGPPNSEPSTQTATPSSTPGSTRRDSIKKKTSYKQHEVKMVEANPLCTPRFMQALVVLLIIVMSASAIAMAVLFALSSSSSITTTTKPIESDRGGNNSESSLLLGNGSANTTVAGIRTTMTSLPTGAPTALVAGIQTALFEQAVIAATTYPTVGLKSTQSPQVLPTSVQTSIIPLSLLSASSSVSSSASSSVSSSASSSVSSSASSSASSIEKSTSSPTMFPATLNSCCDPRRQSPSPTFNVSDDSDDPDHQSTSQPPINTNQQPDDDSRKQRRQAGGLTLVLSSVRLIAEGSDGFNISFNPTCGSACSGNYTYSVSIPGNIMTNSVTLEMSSLRELYILLCHHDSHNSCFSGPIPSHTPVHSVALGTLHRWRLPISYFVHTGYDFIVTDSPSVNCSVDPSQSGPKFSVYSFRFSRVCGLSQASPS